MSITSDSPLKFCCAVCGKAVASPIVPLPGLGDDAARTCSSCGQTVCAEHFSNSRKKCVRCTKGSDSWCQTPKLPKLF